MSKLVFQEVNIEKLFELIERPFFCIIVITAEGCPPCAKIKADLNLLYVQNDLRVDDIYIYNCKHPRDEYKKLKERNLWGFPQTILMGPEGERGRFFGHLKHENSDYPDALLAWIKERISS